LLNFLLSEDKYLNLQQKASVSASMFESIYICDQAFSLMKIKKSKQQNCLTDENLASILRLTTTNIMPHLKHLVSTVQAPSLVTFELPINILIFLCNDFLLLQFFLQ
jgi:hypothetical protein